MTLEELRLISNLLVIGWFPRVHNKELTRAKEIIQREINLKTTDYVKGERQE